MHKYVDHCIIAGDAMLETFSSQKTSCHESHGHSILDVSEPMQISLVESLVQIV